MNTWTTVGTISNEYLTTSDATFAFTDEIYFGGPAPEKTIIYVSAPAPDNSLSDVVSTTFMFDTTTIELTTGTGIIEVEVSTITRGDNFDMQGFRPSFITEAWPASSENDHDHGTQVFAFGGHNLYDEACKCFPTSNEITMQQW